MSQNRRLRVAALAPYPEQGPSTRFRLAQFVAPLADRGIDVEIVPFVSSADYTGLYASGGTLSKAALLVRGLSARRSVFSGPPPDLWLVHRELAPLSAGWLARALEASAAPWVFDFDDAIYLDPVGGSALLAPFRRPEETTARLCRGAAGVLAGNATLAAFAESARDEPKGVHHIPTVIDTDRFRPPEAAEADSADPVLGWIGTHTTARYLTHILPALEDLFSRIPFRLRVVSNRPPEWNGTTRLPVDFERWSPEREVAVTQELDVGLYPLEDTPWTRGKCGFKAIQYLACGVPVVCSSVGVLPQVVPDGIAGVQVPTGGDWAAALEPLLTTPEARRRLGGLGRQHVVETYSVAAVVDRMASIMRDASNPAR